MTESQIDGKTRKKRDGESQAYRILNMTSFLLACPQGATRQELADHFNVHRTTISRDLGKISEKPWLIEDDFGRLSVDRTQYLADTRFTLHEVMALYLATRLLSRRTDKRNQHAASAVRKLGSAVQRLAPNLSRQIILSAEILDSPERKENQTYISVLETLTRAWAENRYVHISYLKNRSQVETHYTLAPYFLEPYAVGQTTYVIGVVENESVLKTFKVERIVRAELLTETYHVPVDFNIGEHLGAAWGIWTSQEEPVQIVLRFGQDISSRVMETHWHQNQEIVPQTDGSLIWKARVANLTEMMPWILGWGANVEVLEPPDLRKLIAEEVKVLTRLYGLDD
jgi:predicted DNA-binding transcriptional regulator YafY